MASHNSPRDPDTIPTPADRPEPKRRRLSVLLLALAALAATTLTVAPAAPAAADPLAFHFCIRHTWPPRCGVIYTPVALAPDPGNPCSCPLAVQLGDNPAINPPTYTNLEIDLLTGAQYLGQAAVSPDQGQTNQLRTAALSAYTQAALTVDQTGLPALEVGYLNPTTGQLVAGPQPPHPWMQQFTGDWSTAIGLLQDSTTNPTNAAADRQQAAAYFDDAYQLLTQHAQA